MARLAVFCAMLRVVEVHRTAEGGWELVEGAPKPLHTVDAGGSDSASVAAIPAFLPLAALFAECLQQDSQMDAVVEGGWGCRGHAPACPACTRTCRTDVRIFHARCVPSGPNAFHAFRAPQWPTSAHSRCRSRVQRKPW